MTAVWRPGLGHKGGRETEDHILPGEEPLAEWLVLLRRVPILRHTLKSGLIPCEGHVNKLKMIKRVMFGRAGFAVLRQRVLHAV